MVEVQLRGFPQWTESEDLKFTVDECGFPCLGLRINWNQESPEKSIADVTFLNWEAAEAVVERLHKFEFTPGYPLQARVKPGQNKQDAAPYNGAAQQPWLNASGASQAIQYKSLSDNLRGKGTKNTWTSSGKPDTRLEVSNANTSAANCIGAGRIDGWMLNERSKVLQKGWGNVQSFSFEGNLVFRPPNSPAMKNVDFKQKDAVSFEVVFIKGQCEAVRLATPETEHLVDNNTPIVEAITYGGEGVDEDQLRDEHDDPIPSMKSMKRRQREESDHRMCFFGGFGPEITEDTLWKFAEQAGEVKKVKLFYNINTWESKGCGKVMYAELEGSEKACNELSGTVLNERIVTVELLGSNSNPNPNAGKKPKNPKPPPREDFTDDMPKQLPLSMFGPNDTPQQKLEICYAAFDDLINNHDAEKTGYSMIIMIRKLIMEVNDIFGEDEENLQTWVQHLRKYQWFRDNGQMVKWQASKKRVNVSKVSPNTGDYIRYAQTLTQQVEQRKLEQQIMGKPVFEVSEEEKARARKAPPMDWVVKGEGKGKGNQSDNYGGYSY